MKKFLICGCYRSGTSIFSKMLNFHKDICSTNELGIYYNDDFFKRVLLLCKKKLKRDCGLGINYEEIDIENLTKKDLFQIIECKYKVYCDKYPRYTFNLDGISVDGVIFIYRHPLEVIESQTRMWRKKVETMSFEKFLGSFPYAREKIEDCFERIPGRNPPWIDYFIAWEEWKNKTNVPTFEINYKDFKNKCIDLSNFLGVDGLELQNIFNEKYKNQSYKKESLGDVKLPQTWIDKISQYDI